MGGIGGCWGCKRLGKFGGVGPTVAGAIVVTRAVAGELGAAAVMVVRRAAMVSATMAVSGE